MRDPDIHGDQYQRAAIFERIQEYYHQVHQRRPLPHLVPGRDYLPTAAKCVDDHDIIAIVDSALDLWFTHGRYAQQFESEFAAFMEQRHCLVVNSGSSANLLALTALTANELGSRRIQAGEGDEVITVACGFPTTVNPIIQIGAVPVFIDCEPVEMGTYQIDASLIELAITPKTKAIIFAHALGNVANLAEIKALCERHQLWLVEDCCDAVGARYQKQMVGTFGDLATVSFYPAHHLTMGEGGAVLTNNPQLARIAESMRDWGRDCHCATGQDNCCGRRFAHQLGELPLGYDHKYIYSQIGYNFKITEMQAALGVAQLKKLPQFIERRKANFSFLKARLTASGLEEHLILPQASAHADPCWFGFPLTLRLNSADARRELMLHLEANKIGTRMIFAGNLLRQPLYRNVTKRVASTLHQSDHVMNRSFWLGIHPQLSEEALDYMAKTLKSFHFGTNEGAQR